MSNRNFVHFTGTFTIKKTESKMGNGLKSCNPVGMNLLKVNNRNTRTRCEIYSKLTIKTPERRHWRRSGIFVVNFEHNFPAKELNVKIIFWKKRI